LSPNNLHLLFSSAIPSSLSTVYSACPFSFICQKNSFCTLLHLRSSL
jgi:hypothetical protein